MGLVKVHGNEQDYRDELHRQSRRILDLVQENEQLRKRVKILEHKLGIKATKEVG